MRKKSTEYYYYRPRFSFEITEEQQRRANKLLGTYGVRKVVMQKVLDDLLDAIETHGPIVIAKIGNLNQSSKLYIKAFEAIERGAEDEY